jgi:hypothetical protein
MSSFFIISKEGDDMPNNPVATIGVQLAANSQKVIQDQVDAIAKNIKLNLVDINLNDKAIASATKKIKDAMSSTGAKQATQEISNYEKALNKLIHTYKAKAMSDDEFVKRANKAMSMNKYQELSWQKQEQLINLIARAEKNYQTVSDKTRSINAANAKEQQAALQSQINYRNHLHQLKTKEIDNAHKEALLVNKQFDAQKQAEAKLANQIADGRKKSMDKIHAEALKANKEFDRLKAQEVTNVQKAEQKKEQLQQKAEQKAKQVAERYEQMWQKALKNRELQEQRLTEKILQQEQLRISRLNNNTQSSSVRIYDPLQQQSEQANLSNRLTGLGSRISTVSRSNLIDRSQLASINTEYQRLESTIGRISNNRMQQQWNTDYTRLNQRVRELNQTVEEGNHGFRGYLSNLGMIVKKFADWVVVGNLVMGVMRQFQNTVQYVKEMDAALTSLSKVTNFTKNTLNEMRDAAIAMGKDLGHSSVDIAKSMAEFGRVTKNKEEIKELSRVNVYCPVA